MENTDKILEFAKEVDSIWKFLTLLLIVFLVVGIPIIVKYRKGISKILNNIIDRFSGKKDTNKLSEISKQLEILTIANKEIKENEKVRREMLLSEIGNIKKEISNANEKNEAQHKDLFEKLEKIGSESKINTYINHHTKVITEYFHDFCNSDLLLNKNLKDILKEGIDRNKAFFSEMIIVGLDDVNMIELSAKLSSEFRTLRNSSLFDRLDLSSDDLSMLKQHIRDEICNPLIKEFISELRAHKVAGKKNGDLIMIFSNINFELIKGVLIHTRNFFNSL